MTDQELRLFIKKHRLEEVERLKKELLQELTGIAGQLEQTKDKLQHNTEEAAIPEAVVAEADGGSQDQEALEERISSEKSIEKYTEANLETAPCVRKANKVVIGIAGTQHRIGCTHAGIMLSSYLQRCGFKTALLEYGRSDAMEVISVAGRTNFDTYGNVTAESLLQILSSKFYHFLLIDYGLYEECDQLMYNRSDIRLLLAGVKEWETSHLNRIFEKTEAATLRQMNFLFNFVPDMQQKAVRREMAELGAPYFLPLLADPFSAENENIGDMKMLFREYLEEQQEHRWKKLFKR